MPDSVDTASAAEDLLGRHIRRREGEAAGRLPLLTAAGLTKDYGSFRALDALDLRIASGEVFGLLGPNGSGKSTALRLMLGFLRPTAGRATLAGFDCWAEGVEARKRVAYLPGELRLYETMTGRRLVTFLAGLRGETPGPAVDELAKKLDIDIDRPLTHMSSGMKRKVALLTVLVPRVPLIVLDEPTNTLDPTMRDELLDQLAQAKARGQAVLFSSHVLQEVEAVCDRVGILRRGKLVHLQDMTELRDGRAVTARLTGPAPATGPDGGPLPADATADGRLTFTYRGPLPALLVWLAGQPLADLRIEPQGLGPIYRRWHGG
ncbi:MAG TPA: ABC transporter ATP-binding protein [Urbifossiella sp.]|jgi:ABC-2 type transport system ATP-binding protein|nr:ABC transporter ATP-binding protein [Urbifossiella sp.]